MMSPSQAPPSGRHPLVIFTLVLLILVVAGGVWWWLRPKAEDPAVTADSPLVRAEIETQAPLVAEDLETPSETQVLMEQRKAQLGLETGVDMIVRSDETIQIDDIRIPMSEILDKIRIKEGQIVEKELIGTPSKPGRDITPDGVNQRSRHIKERMAEIEGLLNDPKIQGDVQLKESLRQEQSSLAQTAETLRRYLENQARLEAVESQIAEGGNVDLEALEETRDSLRQAHAALEEAIASDPYWDNAVDAYGIYIVRGGDNIWNIHFQFLRNYFNRKGIQLEATSDEPTTAGSSSGVGKILKFSEKMVNIYNIRQRRLEMDLDTIHPLSKIVVFNLERVFSLLKQIDHRNVQRVEFDGETLWVPADQ
ncbi:MAG: hypothetical protein WBG37_00980 [Desulfobacterales bacterium]